MADFIIRRGDRLPNLEATLTGSDNIAANLTGATVRFHMRAPGAAAAKVAAPATIVSPVDGTVRYQWAAVDTDTPGRYRGEFEVTFADTRKQTFPSPGYLTILVTDELA